MRRLVIAIARAVALFILVTGIYGALAIGLPQWPVLNRSIAALLVGVTIFEMLRPARRKVAGQAPAQEVPPPTAIDNSVELAEARATNEHLRDALEKARNRESEIRSEYERESEHLQRAASRALEEIQRTRSAHDELRGHMESERARASEAQRELEKARDTEQRLGATMQELEALRAERQRIARELEQARQKSEVDKTKLADLQREVDLTHATSQKVVQANETLKKQFDDERQRMQAELQRLQSDRDKMQSEARSVGSRGDELIAQLDRERKLSQELGATRAKLADENAALKKARDAAKAEVQSLKQRIESTGSEHETALAEAVAAREAVAGAMRNIQQKVAALESDLAETREQHAGSQAEGESLKQQLASAQQESDLARKQLDDEWSAKLQKIVSELAADHENDLGEAIADREVARAELRSVQQQTSSLQHGLEESRRRLELASQESERALKQLDEEWSAKLQRIVNGLTADHENDIGEAIAKREEARAEARALHMKIGKLEDDIETLKEHLKASVTAPMPAMVDEKALREQIEAEWSAKVRTLKQQLEAVDEKALREKIDTEWSGKLQTIVSHIASDHEADIGKAIEEREAARAEVRNLNIKMTGLQQKLEGERQAREALQTRYRELEDQLRSAPTQPMHALAEAFPMPEPQPQEEQQARANVLEFAEQAFEALKRATSPGTVPVPQVEEKKTRILIVHHDPRFRSMWGDFLEKSGFAVQTAADGLAGLRVVQSDKPAAVIADAAMPKMDGRELCQAIKSNPETAEVKVILLSGMYTNDMPLPGTKAEFEPDELLRKPVKLEAMKTALSNLLAAAS